MLNIKPVPGSSTDGLVRHLNQTQLARRWNLSERTLERWRWRRQGPPYLKVGGRVLYRLEDIEEFERRQVHFAGEPMSERRLEKADNIR